MTPHEIIYGVLSDLAGGRVFPGVAEPETVRPYITFQVIAGPPINFITGEKPAKRFVRVQANCWADSAIEASQVGQDIEDTLRANMQLQTEVLTGATDTYDDVTKYRGTMQDFQLFI